MTVMSPSVVGAAVLVGILVTGSAAVAQTPLPAGEIDVTVAVTQVTEGLPDVLPTIPIRDWRLEDVAAADAAAVTGQTLGQVRPPAWPRLPRPQPGKPRSAAYKGAQRVLAGVAMGILGFIGGLGTGALVGGSTCACDDGALTGMVIGAPVGAAVGALAGVLLVR
jgi:hypothetical protein